MTQTARSEITGILLSLQEDEAGRREYTDRLFEHVYNELHRIAVDLMHQQRADHTLQPTAIVHEAYLRLVDQTRTDWQDRAHFFRTAAQAMRQILVAHERRRTAAKRGGGGVKVTLDEQFGIGAHREIDVLALDDVLTRLAEMDERMAQVVELRVFAGMTVAEAAFALNVSDRTVHDDWRVAKMWLRHELPGGPAP
jgi:RNA polymerase sigma-70 factor (ECF subfamily)